MNSTRLILLFFVLLFLQVFIFNNMVLLDYITPFVYIVFIFYYPLKESRFLFLSVIFLLGLCVDFFSNTGGIHAFAILFSAYFRLFFIKLFFNKTEVDFPFFNLREEAYGKVFNYIISMTFIHHFLVLMFANLTFKNMPTILISAFLSSIFTIMIFIIGDIIFRKQ